MRARLIFTLMCCSVSASLHAEPIAIKGFQLGQTKAELRQRFPSLSCGRAETKALGEETCSGLSHRTYAALPPDLRTYAGEPVDYVLFGIVAGKVEHFYLTFSPSSYPAIRNALMAVHGQGREDSRQLQTGAGAKLVSRTWTAHSANGVIEAREHAGQVDRAFVRAESAAFGAWSGKTKADAARSAPADL